MRKMLIGSILAITSIVSISFADYIQGEPGLYEFDIDQPQQIGNYTYEFDNEGDMSTDDFGAVYLPYGSPTTTAIYGRINGKLYYYSYKSSQYGTTINQGYLKNWCVSENLTDCNGQSTNTNYNVPFENIKDTIGTIQNTVLGSSDALYWGAGDPSWNTQLCFYDGINYYCVACNNQPSTARICNSGLEDDQQLDLSTYEKARLYNWGPSPLTPTLPNGKPDTEGVCMTIQDMLNRQNETYNTGMCYSNTRYLTSTGRVTNTPKFITELYPTYTELRQDMNLYTNYCTPPANMNYCQQAFSGKEDNYTLIQKIPATTDLTVLYDFCTTYQTRSGNLQKNVCDMTEEERKNLRPSQQTQEGYAERIAKHPTTTTKPGSGTVYDDIVDENARDLIDAIPRVYTKITGIFKARRGVNGIIPDYITWILLLIVLFKLFKK